MKRYNLTLTLGVSAKDEQDAKDKLIKLIESGSYVTPEGKYLSIKIKDPEGIDIVGVK